MTDPEEYAKELRDAGKMIAIKPPKSVECRKCGEIEVGPGTVMAMGAVFKQDNPPRAEMLLRCECGRTVAFDVEITDTDVPSSN